MKPTLKLTLVATPLSLMLLSSCQTHFNGYPQLNQPFNPQMNPYQSHRFFRLSNDNDVLGNKLKRQLKSISKSGSMDFFIMPESDDYNTIPQDPKNPITPAKVRLGKLLFHETGLANNNKSKGGQETYSCASCHHVAGGFQANRVQGLAEGGLGFGQRGEGRFRNPESSLQEIDFQPLRTPAALNTAWQKNMLWNGSLGANGVNQGTEHLWVQSRQRSTLGLNSEDNKLGFDGIETQAIVGQDAHRLSVHKSPVMKHPTYQKLFKEAYPGNPKPNKINAGLAIAAYERTLMANRSPFQRWLKGDRKAMNTQQLKGALLFFDKAKCVTCHTGPALNSMEFHAMGMKDLVGAGIVGSDPSAPQHLGRASFTKKAEDRFKFKVPQLYNLADSPFLGHGSSFHSIEEVVHYYHRGRSENARVPNSQLAEEFKPLHLSPQERKALTYFLKSALYDPNLSRYVPRSLPSGNCFPNNDNQSRKDLGCN